MYILRSLATVNTCVLPVLLSAQGVEGAEEIVTSMFHAFISSIHFEHDDEGKTSPPLRSYEIALFIFSPFFLLYYLPIDEIYVKITRSTH